MEITSNSYLSILTAPDWADVKEDKSKMVLEMLEMIKANKTEIEYLEYLHALDKGRIFEIMSQACLVGGFNLKWRVEIKKIIKEKFPDGSFLAFSKFIQETGRTVFNIASDEVVNNYEYMKQYVTEDKFFLNKVKENMNSNNIVKHAFDLLERNEIGYSIYPQVAFANSNFVKAYFERNPEQINAVAYCSNELKTNTALMFNVMSLIAPVVNSNEFYSAFNYLPNDIRDDIDFVKHFMQFHNNIIDCVSEETRNAILGKVVKVEVVEKAVEVKSTKTKKESKTKSKSAKTKTVELAEVNIERFEQILANVTIEEKPHSITGEILKVFKVSEDLGDDFISFSTYVQKNDIAYYSKFARAFIVKNIDKVAAASVAAVYSSDLLNTFANGTLF